MWDQRPTGRFARTEDDIGEHHAVGIANYKVGILGKAAELDAPLKPGDRVENVT